VDQIRKTLLPSPSSQIELAELQPECRSYDALLTPDAEVIPPLGAVRRGLPTKAHGLRNDIADVTAIALLRRAITGTMGEQFAHSKA
jgi:hypothetical protein